MLDLYEDELVPASLARKSRPIARCLGVCSGVPGGSRWRWFCLHRGPAPTPDDLDPPGPVASGLHVLIVEETADRKQLTAGQVAIFTSIPLREWYEANCAKRAHHSLSLLRQGHEARPRNASLERHAIATQARAAGRADEPMASVGQQMKLPSDPDAMKAELEKFKRRR